MSVECTEYEEVVRSTTLPLSFGVSRDGVEVTDLTDWACKIQMRNQVSRELAGVDRVVTTKNVDEDRFITTLTSSETSVDLGKYVIAAELTNSITLEVLEGLKMIKITEEWVYS